MKLAMHSALQSQSDHPMKIFAAFVTVSVGCSIGLATVGTGWIRAFAKTEQPLIYATVFPLLMFASLIVAKRFVTGSSVWSRAIVLVILGELSTLIALGVSIANYPGILSRLKNAIAIGNLSDALVPVLFSSFLLGGWLLVPLGAIIAEALTRSVHSVTR